MHYRVLSNIPDLYPLDAGSTSPQLCQSKMSPDIAQYPRELGGTECPWLRENHKGFWSVTFLLICGPRMSLALPLHHSNSRTISFPGSLITIIEMKL